MPEDEVRLVFGGVTALARAFSTVTDHGLPCRIAGAPPGGSPCGLALAVDRADLAPVLQVLATAGLRPGLSRPVAEVQK